MPLFTIYWIPLSIAGQVAGTKFSGSFRNRSRSQRKPHPSTQLTKTRRVPHPRFVRVGLRVEVAFAPECTVLSFGKRGKRSQICPFTDVAGQPNLALGFCSREMP